MFRAKKIQFGTCLSMGTTLYFIMDRDEIIHLTFEKQKHIKAVEKLENSPISSKYLAGTPSSHDQADSHRTTIVRQPACANIGHWPNIYRPSLSELFHTSRIFTIPIPPNNPPFCRKFSDYLAGKKTSFGPVPHSPFLERGTEFQKKVWKLISRIPYGETRTYGELARQLGSIGYARGVGQACRTNPLPLFIPCHRVVGSQGLGGFSGGIEIKKKLLEVEGCRLKAKG